MTLRIYTELTSDNGGIWAFKPFAMVHVCWVSELDYHNALDRAEAAARIRELEAKLYRITEERDRALEWRDHDKERAVAAEAKVAEMEEGLVKAEREACAARLDAIAAIYAADATGLRAEGSEDGGGYDRDAEVIRIAAAAIRARGEG